jgi:hypothetical protein
MLTLCGVAEAREDVLRHLNLVSYSAAVGDGVGDGYGGLIDEALIR